MVIDTVQHKQQREAMERQRFGKTRAEIFAEKGTVCKDCGKDMRNNLSEAVIDHEMGGGRHFTERGMMNENTHDTSKMAVRCKSCAGRRDRIRGSVGMGLEGNPNNPSQ